MLLLMGIYSSGRLEESHMEIDSEEQEASEDDDTCPSSLVHPSDYLVEPIDRPRSGVNPIQ